MADFRDDSIGIVERQYFTYAKETPMHLDSGETLGPITLAYETYGQLNAKCNNAILICHALSGDSHVAGYYTPEDQGPGWWDECVGPGKAFDTTAFSSRLTTRLRPFLENPASPGDSAVPNSSGRRSRLSPWPTG